MKRKARSRSARLRVSDAPRSGGRAAERQQANVPAEPAAPVPAAAALAPAPPQVAPVAAPPAAHDPEPQLVVAVSGALYAVPIMGIEEILPMREVAPLPRSASAVRGVLFLRGHPVTVVDLGLLLGGSPTRGSRIVVLKIEEERYGLVVDQVLKVISPDALQNSVCPPAALQAAPAVRAVARLGEEVVTLLDLERLIPAPAVVRAGA